MEDRIIIDLVDGFSKPEIIQIAADLEMEVSEKKNVRVIIKSILEDIDKNGVPEVEDMTPIMKEFLQSAEIIDEDGNVLEKGDNVPSTEDIVLPQCFGLADIRDPACKRCKVYDRCVIRREESLPECFGKLYQENDDNCAVCFEAARCRDIVKKIRTI